MKIPFPKNFEPQKPLKIYDYQDITIIVFPKSFNLSQCNLNNLYQQDIIPLHWRLKSPTINKPDSFQVSFQEGISITVEARKISFSVRNYISDISLESIIWKFINSYIGNNFIKIQIILRRLITLPSSKKTGLNFIKDNILQLEDRQMQINNTLPKKIQLNFLYQYNNFPFLISLIDTPVNKNNKIYSGLLFRGFINYGQKEKLAKKSEINVFQLINNLSHFLTFFNQVTNQYFS